MLVSEAKEAPSWEYTLPIRVLGPSLGSSRGLETSAGQD
jgi:hypothetical protein